MAKKYNLTCYDKRCDIVEIESKTLCVELPVSDDGDAVIIEISCTSLFEITIKNMCKHENIKMKTNIKDIKII